MAPRNVWEFATTANDNVNNTAVKKRFMSTLPCRRFDHSWHGNADFAFPKRTSAAARPRLVALFKAIYGCTGQYGLLKASYSSEKVAVNKNFRRRELKFLRNDFAESALHSPAAYTVGPPTTVRSTLFFVYSRRPTFVRSFDLGIFTVL